MIAGQPLIDGVTPLLLDIRLAFSIGFYKFIAGFYKFIEVLLKKISK